MTTFPLFERNTPQSIFICVHFLLDLELETKDSLVKKQTSKQRNKSTISIMNSNFKNTDARFQKRLVCVCVCHPLFQKGFRRGNLQPNVSISLLSYRGCCRPGCSRSVALNYTVSGLFAILFLVHACNLAFIIQQRAASQVRLRRCPKADSAARLPVWTLWDRALYPPDWLPLQMHISFLFLWIDG